MQYESQLYSHSNEFIRRTKRNVRRRTWKSASILGSYDRFSAIDTYRRRYEIEGETWESILQLWFTLMNSIVRKSDVLTRSKGCCGLVLVRTAFGFSAFSAFKILCLRVTCFWFFFLNAQHVVFEGTTNNWFTARNPSQYLQTIRCWRCTGTGAGTE